MSWNRRRGAVLAAMIVAIGVAAGWAVTHRTALPAATLSPAISTPAAAQPSPNGNHGGGGGAGRATATAPPGLPADWPADLAVPPGSILGSTGSGGQWSVLLLVQGPADQVLRSAAAFYVAAGFTQVTDSILNRGNRHLTLGVQNQDHSAAQTNLIIGVTTS